MKKPRAFDPTKPVGCAYIAGDPHVVRRHEDPFCGKAREPGSAYCLEHHEICWRPAPKRITVVSSETGRVFR